MAGFTLLEIIAVLALLGILAIVAIPRYTSLGIDAISDSDILIASTRQAQMRAMGDISSANWKIIVADKTVNIQNGTSVLYSNSLTNTTSGFSIAFDNKGRVSTTTGSIPFTIDTETGYIP